MASASLLLLADNPLHRSFNHWNHNVYFDDKKVVYGSPKEIYRDLYVYKSLNKAKFPVYLVCSRVNKQHYAMKVFEYQNGQPHPYFKNEIRFACLQHSNIIRNLYIENDKETLSEGATIRVSYVIMEYAPYGDFFDFIMDYGHKINTKLARTYFRQLIEGLEYLHKNGVSHMDLKLENLLLGKDYILKIADFDLSHFKNDTKVLSKGTRFYRAPEVLQQRCQDTKAADIYSAGVVLFTFLTKGILPHSETTKVRGIDFSELLHNEDPKFWTKHCEVMEDKDLFDQDFKELFTAMTRPQPENRITIEKIKKSKWYNGPYYNAEELKIKVGKVLGE